MKSNLRILKNTIPFTMKLLKTEHLTEFHEKFK